MAKGTKEIRDRILEFIVDHPLCTSKEVYDHNAERYSYATVKRNLQALGFEKLIVAVGQRKGTRYKIADAYILIRNVNLDTYFKKEIDERKITAHFNYTLIPELLPKVSVFSDEELNLLNQLQKKHRSNITTLNKAAYQKDLERLAIDLSWKSSQIEGNTYSLLETERLLKEREIAKGKSKEEAQMLINHKEALDYIIDHPKYIDPLSVAKIENIHSILIADLKISRNIRKRRVGISGTNYTPLDNEFQIKEAMDQMCKLINNKKNVFEKALLALALISYIQPFFDGNKRTARIISNSILIKNNYCPISFRTVESIDYKKAMLVFYEQNNISAIKKIFVEQFAFAVNTYF